ncbi:MAG: hypothetical protein JWN03_4993 [Nocardia sp.]|nr:hypothetical protein [Nocardia sp.]
MPAERSLLPITALAEWLTEPKGVLVERQGVPSSARWPVEWLALSWPCVSGWGESTGSEPGNRIVVSLCLSDYRPHHGVYEVVTARLRRHTPAASVASNAHATRAG